jgi:predicted metal-dependent HD superfamily phosphohydrolase
MKAYSKIVKLSEAYVIKYLDKNLPPHFLYHNIKHTKSVVKHTKKLCSEQSIKSYDTHALLIAAWFHDVGYTVQVENHEMYGVEIVEKFLKQHEAGVRFIELVKSLIIASKYPQNPKTKLEEILCDADLLHLADEKFVEKSQKLREEWSECRNVNYSDDEWYRLNLDFVAKHTFHTKYAKSHFTAGKEANRNRLEQLLQNSSSKSMVDNPTRLRKQKYVKGTETLFRNSSRNHMELSSMADNKAHILLSVSSLILSVFISFVFPQLEVSPYLIAPTAVMTIVCLATIVLAVFTTKPKISKGVFTMEDIQNRNANLLFFGNFHKMDMNMYEWGINEMMSDKQYLFSSMTKDIYYVGKVLALKYRYLSIGYKVFMYGLITSVLSFPLSYLFFE